MNPDELIAPALRHESVPWPARATEALQDALLAAAADHAVDALLATAPAVESWPDRVRSTLRSALRIEAVVEAVRREALSQVLADFGAAGIRPLLLKGGHLAYTHYPRPWLRPRLDTDLLVEPGDRTRADEVLRKLGYRLMSQVSGDLVRHSLGYKRLNRYGFPDIVDLHWKVANPHVFAGAFTFEELECGAVPIADLGPNARGLSDMHALVLACVHRVAHHDNSDRLIWLYDIHLLASAMNSQCREGTADLAAAKRLSLVCAHSIAHAQGRFATAVPRAWVDRLQATGADNEPTAAFLQNSRTRVDGLVSDLRALNGWRPRLELIREHLFPPVSYMRQVYAFSNPALIPFAYAHRIATGIRKWVRHE